MSGGFLDQTSQLCFLDLSFGVLLLVVFDGRHEVCLRFVLVRVVKVEPFLRLSELHLPLLRSHGETAIILFAVELDAEVLLYLGEGQHVRDPFWCEPYGIRVPGQVPDQLDGTGTSLAPNFHRFACSSYIFQQLRVAEHVNGRAVVEEDPLLRDSSLTNV